MERMKVASLPVSGNSPRVRLKILGCSVALQRERVRAPRLSSGVGALRVSRVVRRSYVDHLWSLDKDKAGLGNWNAPCPERETSR